MEVQYRSTFFNCSAVQPFLGQVLSVICNNHHVQDQMELLATLCSAHRYVQLLTWMHMEILLQAVQHTSENQHRAVAIQHTMWVMGRLKIACSLPSNLQITPADRSPLISTSHA